MRTQLLDDVIRGIRRRALSKEELSLIDETAPVHIHGEELQRLAHLANEKDAWCAREDPEGATEECLDEFEMDLQQLIPQQREGNELSRYACVYAYTPMLRLRQRWRCRSSADGVTVAPMVP